MVTSLKDSATQKEFSNTRTNVQYIGIMTITDVSPSTQLIAPGSDLSTPAEFMILNKTSNTLQSTSIKGINFVSLELVKTRILIMTDASFNNAGNATSRLGFLVVLVDDELKSNIVHYASRRCRSVTR